MVQMDKVREEFAQRLALACKEAGLDDHGRGMSIARALSVSPKAVSKWINGESIPRQDKLNQLANFLHADPIWLQHGTSHEGSNVEYVSQTKQMSSYPLISWVSAGNWYEAVEPYNLKSIDEWYESDVHMVGEGFWLRVQGDSMTSPVGLSIPEGMIILVDTGREALNGSLVIAKSSRTNEATFKKLVNDGGNYYLKPLNPSYPMISLNGEHKILGVVVEAKIRFV
ncbi:TPA: LexA family protein [Salmonella enterica subsp. enterica serovar Muenchen]|nr:helix-turn-helix domain-containing protein [Salmonella enterica subsp. enterica]HAF1587714.1 helix-turn-helix domain-containing protein [Salmonella enterica]